MVLAYLPTFARTKSPSHVGKYTIHGAYGIRYIDIVTYIVYCIYKCMCISMMRSNIFKYIPLDLFENGWYIITLLFNREHIYKPEDLGVPYFQTNPYMIYIWVYCGKPNIMKYPKKHHISICGITHSQMVSLWHWVYHSITYYKDMYIITDHRSTLSYTQVYSATVRWHIEKAEKTASITKTPHFYIYIYMWYFMCMFIVYCIYIYMYLWTRYYWLGIVSYRWCLNVWTITWPNYKCCPVTWLHGPQ